MVYVGDFSKYYMTNNLKANSYYEYYEQRYLRSPWAVQWNWAAGIFGIFWLLYRKAYRAFIAALLVKFLISSLFGPVSFMVSFLLFAMFGNNLYFWDLNMRIAHNSQATGTGFSAVLVGGLLVIGGFLVTLISAGISLAKLAGLFIPFATQVSHWLVNV